MKDAKGALGALFRSIPSMSGLPPLKGPFATLGAF
jgi:hypothetical protein